MFQSRCVTKCGGRTSRFQNKIAAEEKRKTQMPTELIIQRDQLIEQLKKVRTKLKQFSKYPLPNDSQVIWIINKTGRRRFKATYYKRGSLLAPKFLGDRDSVAWWNDYYQKKFRHYLVPHPMGEFYIIGFKSNRHAKNGGWEPFLDQGNQPKSHQSRKKR